MNMRNPTDPLFRCERISRTRRYYEFVFAVFLLTTPVSRSFAQATIMKWTVDGEKREALVFAPTTDMAVKRPLVFAFHGHGGNMQHASQSMHIHTVWPEAIVVYPQGL